MKKNISKGCYDCHKKIEIDGNEIKNGFLLVYKHQGQDIKVFKCRECFDKFQGLRNYQECEVYSRVVGYLRPVQQWNDGKKREFKERKEYKVSRIIYS